MASNDFLFLAGMGAWCALAAIWLLALGPDSKAHWMHRLHALLPVAVAATALALGRDSSGARAAGQWLLAGGIMLLFLTGVWIISLVKRNAGLMDVAYTLTTSLTVFALFAIDGHHSARQLLIVALVAIWSARLVHHATGTNTGPVEQQPYLKWRSQFGARWWWWSYFQVFLLQGGLIWVWALPLVLAMHATPGPLSALDIAGTGLWLVGFVFQAGGDWQLRRFKAQPANKGKVMQGGLWSLTRHPNYFGEALMWWAYFVLGLAHPWGWIGIVGPIYVTWFMSRGSAAAMLDRHMLRSKPDYAAYMARVPGFCPFLKSPTDAELLRRHAQRRTA